MTDFPQGDPLHPQRPGAEAPTEPRPSELEDHLNTVTSQDLSAPGEAGKVDVPTPGSQVEDEGPIGEGGPLMGPDSGAGGGY